MKSRAILLCSISFLAGTAFCWAIFMFLPSRTTVTDNTAVLSQAFSRQVGKETEAWLRESVLMHLGLVSGLAGAESREQTEALIGMTDQFRCPGLLVRDMDGNQLPDYYLIFDKAGRTIEFLDRDEDEEIDGYSFGYFDGEGVLRTVYDSNLDGSFDSRVKTAGSNHTIQVRIGNEWLRLFADADSKYVKVSGTRREVAKVHGSWVLKE